MSTNPADASLRVVVEELQREVQSLRRRCTELEAGASRRGPRRSKTRVLWATGIVAVGVALTGGVALAQVTCSQTLPLPLRTFCANSPATADDVNTNFSTLAGWLSAKTGSLTSPDITAQNVAVSGTGALSFGSQKRQMVDLYGGTYGLGVQDATLYTRSSSDFAWYVGGVHSNTQGDAGTGGTAAMTLNAAGNLIVPANKWNVVSYPNWQNRVNGGWWVYSHTCEDGQYVCGINFKHDGLNWWDEQVQLKCCGL